MEGHSELPRHAVHIWSYSVSLGESVGESFGASFGENAPHSHSRQGHERPAPSRFPFPPPNLPLTQTAPLYK